MLKNDLERPQELDRKLKEQGSRLELLDAALRVMGTPDKGNMGALAAAFNTTVTAVYIVLVSLLSMLVLNTVMFFWMLRRNPKRSEAR